MTRYASGFAGERLRLSARRSAIATPRLGLADLVPVGRVGRPHGLDGAFVVEDASEAEERFAVGATLLAAGKPVKVFERISARRSAIATPRLGLA